MNIKVKFKETSQDFNVNLSPYMTLKGEDGITPHIGENENWWLGDEDTGVKASGFTEEDKAELDVAIDDAVNDALTEALESGKFNGKDGIDGKTPYIQDGYWYIDGVNTEVKAEGVDGKDGYTPIKNVDYFTEEDKAELVDRVLEEMPEPSIPSGGLSEAIIDVTELPTENINEDVFYRSMTGRFYTGKSNIPTWACIVVETLPSEGTPATFDMENFTLYYETTSKGVWGYADEALGSMVGIPFGWYPIDAILPMFGMEWGGVVFNETDILSNDDVMRLLIEYTLYQYKERWEKVKGIGGIGTGVGAEVFNTFKNEANGEYSHAEGYFTYADGDYSHTEGGDCWAVGQSSHAEGQTTVARGDSSHAEGKSTIASGDCSHAQGRYNIEDTENKYAHIVGNGINDGARSNAHTLDWYGNAWFAGDITVGGTGQDDPNAKSIGAMLDKFSAWYDESHYVNMTGEFTATNGGGTAETAEIGGEITSTFGWEFSKLPTSLTVGGKAQTPTQKGTTEQTFTASSTDSSKTTQTFTITGVYKGAYGDEKVSKTWTYYFQNKRYTGYVAMPETLNGDFIKSLTGEFATSRGKTFNLNDNTSGKYIWYAYPKRFGEASFVLGAFPGCFDEPYTISVTNGAGFMEDYYLYRSTNAGVGDLEVTVK